jgi:uncharacterized protein
MASFDDLVAAIAVEREGVIVAFSGGVDSSLVAAAACRALGERALAVTAVSPALATGELEAAREVARALGIAHQTIETHELTRAGYRANRVDRCYHCKSELYSHLGAIARAGGRGRVLSGANADDLGDWRPGLRAAAEHSVRHPLVELGIGKTLVRRLARAAGIPSADKPASPCLASRLPYGTVVTPQVLAQVDDAERSAKALGYRILRVRHFGALARVELGREELADLDQDAAADLENAVRRAGYAHVRIATTPFRSGSLNPKNRQEVLTRGHRGRPTPGAT